MIEQDTQLISISDSALTQLRDLLQKQGRAEMGLRVFVQPGGCSGMSYGMGFEDQPEEGDAISEVGGVRLFVDSVSARYIKGAEPAAAATELAPGDTSGPVGHELERNTVRENA